MKFVTSTLAVAMLLASGEELQGIKNQVAAISVMPTPKEEPTGAKPKFAQIDSESDSEDSSSDSEDSDKDAE